MDRIWRSVRSGFSSAANADEWHGQSSIESIGSPAAARKNKQGSWQDDEMLTNRRSESEDESCGGQQASRSEPGNSISDSVDLKGEPKSGRVQIDADYCSPVDSQRVESGSESETETEADSGKAQTVVTEAEQSAMADGAQAASDCQETQEERQRPKMGLSAVMLNSKHRVVSTPQKLPLQSEACELSSDSLDSPEASAHLQASIRSARQLLSLISPSEPGTNTTESSSTEHSADADADSARIWHQHMPKGDQSLALQPPVPAPVQAPQPQQVLLPAVESKTGRRISQLYDQPWDEQAERLQLMLHWMQHSPRHSATAHNPGVRLVCNSQPDRLCYAMAHHCAQQQMRTSASPAFGTMLSSGKCALGCSCGRLTAPAITSFVSPLRQRVSHGNQTLSSGFSYVFVGASGNNTHSTSAALTATPTRRRAAGPKEACVARGPGSRSRQDTSEERCSVARTSVVSLAQDDASGSQSPQSLRPLHESRSWYFGSLSRQDAENLLRNEPESTFLVRKCESSKTDYALSIRSADSFVHMKISRHVHAHATDAVREHYVLGSFSQPYDSVADIVRHFARNTLPVKGVRGLMLKFALHRDRSRTLTCAERQERNRSLASVSLPVANSNTLFRPISSARNLSNDEGSPAHGHMVLKPRFVAQSSLPANTALVVANRAARN